jgi:hypothetical protein
MRSTVTTYSADGRILKQMTVEKSQPAVPFVPLICAALLLVVQFIVTFPGQLVFDSEQQLAQALSRHYGDWHPPVMAFVWTYLIKLSGSRAGLLALHQGLHWLGFGLTADGCHRAAMKRRAWAILVAGAFPFFLIYDKIYLKDVGMGSAFVAAFGLIFWFRVQDRTTPWWAYLLAGMCLLYGGLIRTNSVFAMGPLIYFYCRRGRSFSSAKIIGCSILVLAIGVPLSGWINHRLIGAKSQDPLQSLQIFDLMGIAVHAGDARVWGDRSPALDSIENCYTPYWWDTFGPWGSCQDIRRQIGASADIDTVDQDQVSQRGRLWRRAILQHPWGYAAHRLSHFNSCIYFLVPSLHLRYANAAWILKPFSERKIRLDYLKRNFLFWPVFWIAVGLGGAAFVKVRTQSPTTTGAAKLLMISGLFYSAAYLPIGVATDYRYHYWSIVAILLGVILAADEFPKRFADSPWRGRLAVALVAAVVLAGYYARITNMRLV